MFFRSGEPGSGRIIRHRHDFGAILFLDTRFSLPSTSKYLPSWVKRSHQSYDSPKKLAGLLRGFFNRMKAMQRRGTLQSAKPVVTGRGGIFTTTTGSPMKKHEIDMLKRKNAMDKASQQRQQEQRDKIMEGFSRHKTEATRSPGKSSEVKSILTLKDEDEVQDNSKNSKKRKSLFDEEPNTSPGNSAGVSKKRKKIKIKRKDELEEVLEEEQLKEWKKVLDQSKVEAKNESKNDPFKNDKISNRLCFEMNNDLIPNVVEKYENEVTDKKDFLAILLKFTKHMLARACLLNHFNGNENLDHFQFRWFKNHIIEIGDVASNFLILNHLK